MDELAPAVPVELLKSRCDLGAKLFEPTDDRLLLIPFRYQFYWIFVIMDADYRSADMRTHEKHSFRAPLKHRRA